MLKLTQATDEKQAIEDQLSQLSDEKTKKFSKFTKKVEDMLSDQTVTSRLSQRSKTIRP